MRGNFSEGINYWPKNVRAYERNFISHTAPWKPHIEKEGEKTTMTTSENTPKKNDTYRVDQPRFMSADEIAQTCGISRSTAYRLIRKLNLQLERKNKITVAGKISRRYFEEMAELWLMIRQPETIIMMTPDYSKQKGLSWCHYIIDCIKPGKQNAIRSRYTYLTINLPLQP